MSAQRQLSHRRASPVSKTQNSPPAPTGDLARRQLAIFTQICSPRQNQKNTGCVNGASYAESFMFTHVGFQNSLRSQPSLTELLGWGSCHLLFRSEGWTASRCHVAHAWEAPRLQTFPSCGHCIWAWCWVPPGCSGKPDGVRHQHRAGDLAAPGPQTDSVLHSV